jgi:deoxyhypusine synthase
MTKTFCDICKQEIFKNQNRYDYKIPIYGPTSTYTCQGLTFFTEMKTQDLNVEICDDCRELIGRAIKELIKEDKNV